jgi:hypothetical protein
MQYLRLIRKPQQPFQGALVFPDEEPEIVPLSFTSIGNPQLAEEFKCGKTLEESIKECAFLALTTVLINQKRWSERVYYNLGESLSTLNGELIHYPIQFYLTTLEYDRIMSDEKRTTSEELRI